MQGDKVPMPNAANCFKFRFKFPQTVWMMLVVQQALDCNWSGIFQCTLVYSASGTITYDIFLTEILSATHHIIQGVHSQIHMKNDKFGGP